MNAKPERINPLRLEKATPTGQAADLLLRSDNPSVAPTPEVSPTSRASAPASDPTNTPAGGSGGEDLLRPVVRNRPRYVEQLNTRVTPELRAAVDRHVAATGETLVDLMDRALRLALGLGPADR